MKTHIQRGIFSFLLTSSVFFLPAVASAETSASIPSVTPATTVLNGQTVSFIVMPSGFTNPSYSTTDSFNGSSFSGANMDTYGNFSWTPKSSDGGVHTFTITVSDSAGNPSVTISKTITVYSPTSISVTNPLPGTSVTASSTLTFTISQTGMITPTYRIVDSFYNSTIANASTTSSGLVTWTPAQIDIGSHNLTIFATDPNQRTANTSFSVQVLRTPVSAATSTLTSVVQPLTSTPTAPTLTSSPSYVFSTYLYLGLTHPEVTKLQQRLTALGLYSGPITKYFGPLTGAAVKKFQSSRGLEPVGFVGPGTRRALSQ